MISTTPLIVSTKCDEADNLTISVLSSSKDNKKKSAALRLVLSPLQPFLKENAKVVTHTWMLFSSKERYLTIVLPKEVIIAQTTEYLNFLKFIEHWETTWFAQFLDIQKKIIEKNKPHINDIKSETHIPIYGIWAAPDIQLPVYKLQMLHSGRGMDIYRTLKINKFLLELGYRVKFLESQQDPSTTVEIIIPASEILANSKNFQKLSNFIKDNNPFSYASYARFVADLKAPTTPSHAF